MVPRRSDHQLLLSGRFCPLFIFISVFLVYCIDVDRRNNTYFTAAFAFSAFMTRIIIKVQRTKKNKGNCRVISTARLHASLRFDLPPINAVISRDPQRNTHLEGGFALRCFQRLSRPDAATLQCTWQYNRCTGGPFNPVLSYWGQLSSIFLRPHQIGTELSCDVLNPARVPL